MTNAVFRVPTPVNEPIKAYAPGSPERAELKAEVARQRQTPVTIPLVVNGERLTPSATESLVSPHAHRTKLATAHKGGGAETTKAIAAAVAAQREWTRMAWADRAAVFLKAAELLATKHRARMNAATTLGHS